MTMPPDFPPPPPPPPLPPPPPPEVDEQEDCMAAELLLLPPAPSVSLSLALSAMAAAGWGKEEEEQGGGGGGEGWTANEWAPGEHRGAPSWAPGSRAQTPSGGERKRGSFPLPRDLLCQRTETPPGLGQYCTGARSSRAWRARLGRPTKLAESSGTRPPPPPRPASRRLPAVHGRAGPAGAGRPGQPPHQLRADRTCSEGGPPGPPT